MNSCRKAGNFIFAYVLAVVVFGGQLTYGSLLPSRHIIEIVTDRNTEPPIPTAENEVQEDMEHAYVIPEVWTSWSEWSSCSSTIMVGFRVRNRVCPEGVECPGDDVQLLKCNTHRSYSTSANYGSYKYIEHCKKNDSLSCKLYLENPDLAYNIFRQNSCFFTVNDDENDALRDDNGTGISGNSTTATSSPEVENLNGILSLDSGRETSVRSRNLMQFEEENERTSERNGTGEEEQVSSNVSAYSDNVLNALIEERKCKASCDDTISQATRLWALGISSARSAEASVAMINKDGRLTAGIGVMFYEYNTCISRCHLLKTTFALLSGRKSSASINKSELGSVQGNDPSLKEILKMLEQRTRVERRDVNEEDETRERRAILRRSTEVESLCGGDPPQCPTIPNQNLPKVDTKSRSKRQVMRKYISPCFSRENQVPARTIERIANAELFFFESYVQRFSCRKCVGVPRGKDRLFPPRETVLQWKNKQQAFCRQGFLKRHALFIVPNERGKYRFSNGEKFSIEARTFEVESHCEIVILQ